MTVNNRIVCIFTGLALLVSMGGTLKIEYYDECWNNYEGYCSDELSLCHLKNYTIVKNSKDLGKFCYRDHICCVPLDKPESVARNENCGSYNFTKQKGWPWMGVIKYYGEAWCGATLIENQWLLTVAECFYQYLFHPITAWTVSVGTNIVDLSDPSLPAMEIEKFILHPNYNFPPKANDVALVKLKKPLNLNNTVNKICLPVPDENFVGTICLLLGFGPLRKSTRNYKLNQASIPVVDLKGCARVNCMYGLPVYNTSICTGSGFTAGSPCESDRGGPVLCQKLNVNTKQVQWVLAGIIGTTGSCLNDDTPNINTSVSPYLSWIKKTMNGSAINEDDSEQISKTFPCDYD